MLTFLTINLLLLYAILFEVDWTIDLWRPGLLHSVRVGFTHDWIMHGQNGGASGGADTPYMERWILWLPGWTRGEDGRLRLSGLTLRVHKFWRGDDDSALHDHPWWFWTLPLCTYTERYWDSVCNCELVREVKRLRWHFRPAEHRHIVYMPKGRTKPFYTLVVGGGWGRHWGFWPTPGQFVHWREWVKRGPIAGD